MQPSLEASFRSAKKYAKCSLIRIAPVFSCLWSPIGLDALLATQQVGDRQELAPGSEEEVELRACTVAAVEQLRQALAANHFVETGVKTHSAAPLAKGDAETDLELRGGGVTERKTESIGIAVSQDAESRENLSCTGGDDALPNSVQLDWWLWEQGEKKRASDPPHHRTLTTYY